MKRLAMSMVLLAGLSACGGAPAVQGEMAAATFLVEVATADLEVVGRDRLATAGGSEDRLEVLRPSAAMTIVPIHSSTPVPDPFEFVRDPLSTGAAGPVLEGSERVIIVLHPLIDATPGGRVLAGSLIGFGSGGNVVQTDWDADGDQRIADLLAWGADRGLQPLQTLELAVRGLGQTGGLPAGADEAGDFLR